ncbi:PAS domain S-box-containing protein [Rhizobiales bacterium GAS113]|nr:PAS domain S-box-containing protein [Rhizobiales bacterium GAS113]
MVTLCAHSIPEVVEVHRETARTSRYRRLGLPWGARHAMSLCIALVLCCWAAIASRADDTKRVLIIHSNQSVLPATNIVDASIRREMQSGIPARLEIFSEFLDAEHFPEPEQETRIAAFLGEKYARHPIDLLIATGPKALDFLIKRRAWLFADAPILFAGVREDSVPLRNLPPGVTGITSRFDPVPTVELALRLQPDARQLVVVTGAAAFDRNLEERARRTLRPYEGRLSVIYLSGLPMGELLREVGRLSANTIVLYFTVFQDGAGQSFNPGDVAERLAESASAPVYAIYDSYLGRGIVGGYMDTFDAIGRSAGRLGLRILAGERPETIPPGPTQASGNYIDWRQLQRWGLDASRLPPGSILRFREPSLWESYKWQVVIVVALLIAQSLLIAALVVQGRRRRRAEQAALDSEERMSLATTSANLGLWHWDIASNRLWVSEICRKIVGLGSQANVALETFLGLVHREDLTATRQSLEQATTIGEPDKVEHRLVRPDGSEHWIRAVGRTKFDALGQPARMTGVIIDVTQEKAAERESTHWRQELMHLTRVATLGELSGAMAHELNQPLTAVLANAQIAQLLLSRNDRDLAELREILADIVTDTRRAGEVIRHLRTLFAKSETQIHPLDLNEVVAEVLKLVHSDLVARRINVTSRLAPNLPVVHGDRVQLQQVLLNLIFNACDAMAENELAERDLTVMTAPDGLVTARISIADRGRGIKADMLDRLFKPFVTTKSRGLGLGLSICRSIVEAHGGRMWAINNPERGATFCVALPANGGTRP